MINNIENKLTEQTEKLSKEELEEIIKNVDEQIEEENKPFEEIFNKIKKEAKNFPSLEDFVDEYYNKPGFEFVQDIKYVEPLLGGEDHRWFIVGNSVYSILINGEDYYFGASEVTTLKCETISFEDLKKYGSELKVKEAGKLRIEGKDYVMQDGDICHFRFNV